MNREGISESSGGLGRNRFGGAAAAVAEGGAEEKVVDLSEAKDEGKEEGKGKEGDDEKKKKERTGKWTRDKGKALRASSARVMLEMFKPKGKATKVKEA
jgi:hypothetical protein